MKKTFKKIIAAVVVVGAFAAYVVTSRGGPQNTPNAVVVSDTPPVSTSTPTPAPKPKSAFTDGTYTGVVADAYFGPVQVQAIITNGKLSDVVFLQYPTDRGTSLRKSQQSMPILKSEAIFAQSAQVNMVSGATQTSQGFISSMQSALNQAKA